MTTPASLCHVYRLRHLYPGYRGMLTLVRLRHRTIEASGNSIPFTNLGLGIRLLCFFALFLIPKNRKTLNDRTIKLIECPRDAWQGLPDFIPTDTRSNI